MSSTLHPSPDGDTSIGHRLEAEAISTFLAAAIAVALRTCSRVKYAKLGWDDGIMLFALILALVATILAVIAINSGLGRHLYYLTPWERQQQSKYNILTQTFCIMSLCFCKISICISILRIIQRARGRAIKWFLYSIILLVLIVDVAVVISLYEQCRPVSKVWNHAVPGTCWKYPVELDVSTMRRAFSAFTDFVLSLLPIAIFQHLHIDKRSRITLCVLMGLGCLRRPSTGAIGVVRTAQTALSTRSSGKDSSRAAVLPLIWASVERNVAIMAASIPGARPLLLSLISRLPKMGSKPTYQQDVEKLDSSTANSYSMPGKCFELQNVDDF